MTALILLMVLAILIVVVVILCSAGTIPMNVGIGIRIPATRLSERAWRAGHRAACIPCLIGASTVIVIAGLGVSITVFTAVATAVTTLVLVATLAFATVQAHRAAMRSVGDQ